MTLRRAVAGGLLLIAFALLQGCSEIEPKTGTRVTLTTAGGQVMTREETLAASRYLITQAQDYLNVPKPRIDKASESRLVLLLPGKKIPPEQVDRLFLSASIELYHLSNVATDRHPNRPWHIRLPKSKSAPFVFTGPDSKRIDSLADPKGLLTDVVGVPETKPLLTREDVESNASMQEVQSGWAVLVTFNKAGAKRFQEFTKENPGEYLAVFYDGKLIAAPRIKGPIAGNQAYITGLTSLYEARALVNQLNAGKLPVRLEIKNVERY